MWPPTRSRSERQRRCRCHSRRRNSNLQYQRDLLGLYMPRGWHLRVPRQSGSIQTVIPRASNRSTQCFKGVSFRSCFATLPFDIAITFQSSLAANSVSIPQDYSPHQIQGMTMSFLLCNCSKYSDIVCDSQETVRWLLIFKLLKIQGSGNCYQTTKCAGRCSHSFTIHSVLSLMMSMSLAALCVTDTVGAVHKSYMKSRIPQPGY